MSWNYEELASCLRSQMSSHPPIVVIDDEDTDREEIL